MKTEIDNYILGVIWAKHYQDNVQVTTLFTSNLFPRLITFPLPENGE